MAAATVASTRTDIVGNRRRVSATLTAPADTNTFDSGLYSIDSVEVTSIGSTKSAAADSYSVPTISGGTITIGVVGTARDLSVVVYGI